MQRSKMKRNKIIRIAFFIAVVGAFLVLILTKRNDIVSRIEKEDAQAHFDSIWHEYRDAWKYTHALTPEEENYNAKICAFTPDSPHTGAVLMVAPFIMNSKGSKREISIKLYGDSLTNHNVKLQWNDHPLSIVRVQFASEGEKRNLSAFFLDPYDSMLDSIMTFDSLTITCLTHEHKPAKFCFLLPPLDTVMRKNPKLITYTENDTIRPQ